MLPYHFNKGQFAENPVLKWKKDKMDPFKGQKDKKGRIDSPDRWMYATKWQFLSGKLVKVK